MNKAKTLKWIVIALLLVGTIVGASVLYKKLSQEYADGSSELDIAAKGDGDEGGGTEPSPPATNDGGGDAEAPPATPGGGDENETERHVPTAPDFTVLDVNGREVKLSDYIGMPVVINFWRSKCNYCVLEMPDFNEAYKKYPDVMFLMVSSTDGVYETASSAKAYVRENGYEFDIFFDTDYRAVDAYGITGFPATFFIDSRGDLVASKRGRISAQGLEEGIALIRAK